MENAIWGQLVPRTSLEALVHSYSFLCKAPFWDCAWAVPVLSLGGARAVLGLRFLVVGYAWAELELCLRAWAVPGLYLGCAWDVLGRCAWAVPGNPMYRHTERQKYSGF